MFKMPKAIHVQAVEPLPVQDKPFTPPAPKRTIDPVKTIVLAKMVARDVAITGGVLYAAKKLIDVSTEVAIIAAKAKFK